VAERQSACGSAWQAGPRAFMLPRGRVKYAAADEPDLLRSGNSILVRIAFFLSFSFSIFILGLGWFSWQKFVCQAHRMFDIGMKY
jgi:hypothetical protein